MTIIIVLGRNTYRTWHAFIGAGRDGIANRKRLINNHRSSSSARIRHVTPLNFRESKLITLPPRLEIATSLSKCDESRIAIYMAGLAISLDSELSSRTSSRCRCDVHDLCSRIFRKKVKRGVRHIGITFAQMAEIKI